MFQSDVDLLASRIGTNLKVKVEEKQLLRLKAGTYVEGKSADVGVETTVGLRNVFGGAEQLFFSGAYGTKNSNSLTLNWTKPYFYGLPATLNLSMNDSTTSFLRKWILLICRCCNGIWLVLSYLL